MAVQDYRHRCGERTGRSLHRLCQSLLLCRPFLEGLALREQVSYIAKASLQRFRIIHWFFKTVGVIPIHRDESDVAAIRTSVNALREGRTVGIYPQGTRIPYRVPEPGEAMADWVCWPRCHTAPFCRSQS